MIANLLIDLDGTLTDPKLGDRIHDMDAAKAVGVTSIWVEYGYGDAAERDRAKPDHICASVEELGGLIDTI